MSGWVSRSVEWPDFCLVLRFGNGTEPSRVRNTINEGKGRAEYRLHISPYHQTKEILLLHFRFQGDGWMMAALENNSGPAWNLAKALETRVDNERGSQARLSGVSQSPSLFPLPRRQMLSIRFGCAAFGDSCTAKKYLQHCSYILVIF